MKHLTTLLTMAITFTGLGQQMPYNPDANGDDFVGVDDVLGVLGVYDTALMQPDLQCDYEGTSFEAFVGGLISQTLVLDSVYVEYLIVDSSEVFLPECPDPVTVETVLERSYMITNINFINYGDVQIIEASIGVLGYLRRLRVEFQTETGYFIWNLQDHEISFLTNFEYGSYWAFPPNGVYAATLPFPETWTLDEDGVHLDWSPSNWVFHCDSFRLIPFWHEAE